MIKVYGIKNCNTMKKAFDWLEKNKMEYTFYDYKKAGVEEAQLETWLKKIPMDKLINMKGATWRMLTDKEKASVSNAKKGIQLMMAKTSVIKRPLVEISKGKYLLGFDEEEWKGAF